MTHETKSVKHFLLATTVSFGLAFAAWKPAQASMALPFSIQAGAGDTTRPKQSADLENELAVKALKQAMQQLKEQMPKLKQQLKELNSAKMQADIRRATKELAAIDFKKIQAEVERSLKNIDWKKMEADIQEAMKELEKSLKELQIDTKEIK